MPDNVHNITLGVLRDGPSYNGGYLVTGKTVVSTNDEYYLLSVDTLGLLTNIPVSISKDIGFFIYPNPSDGAFELKADGLNKDFTIKIFSLSGQLLYNESSTLKNNLTHLDLRSSILPGCYILQVTDRATTGSRLLIIK